MDFLKKIKNVPENVKATIAFGAASFSLSGLKYIFTPVFTRLLSTGEYGVLGIYNSWLSIFYVLMSLTLTSTGILNVGLYEHKDNRWKYLSTMLGIITVVSSAVVLIYLCARESVNELIGIPSSLVLIMFITCIFQSAQALWTTKQRYEYNYKIAVPVILGSAFLAQMASVIFVLMRRGTGANLAEARVWGMEAVNIIVGLSIYVHILKKGKCFFDAPLWKETVLLAIPLIPHYLSHVLLHGTDKIMIGRMIGDDKSGIYSLASILSSIGVLFWRALLTSFSPFVNAKIGERQFGEIRRTIKPLWIYAGAMCIIGALIAPEIIKVFGTEEYLEGTVVIPPIAASIFTYAMYDAFAAVSFFHKKSINIMFASVIAAVSNIVMNFFAIQYFGYVAAGYTTLISQIILVLMHYINIGRVEKERVYDGKLSFSILTIVTIACFLCNFLYGRVPYIRYGFVLVILGFLFTYRRTLYKALVDMKV